MAARIALSEPMMLLLFSSVFVHLVVVKKSSTQFIQTSKSKL